MVIDYPVVHEIANGVYSINEFGYDYIYVIIGTQRALVIDSGCGCFDLRAAIRRLTYLPYDVVLTHGHIAQSGGIGQFEKIYACSGEFGRAMEKSKLDAMNFCATVQSKRQAGVWEDRMPKDGIWDAVPEMQEIWDGYVFDLGGRCVKTVRTAGHTYGSCSFIDDKSRIAFVGDAVSDEIYVTECCVTSAIRGLYNLRAHDSEYNRIYASCTGNASIEKCVSIKKSKLSDAIAALKGITQNSISLYPGENGFSGPSNNGHSVTDEETVWTAELSGLKVHYRKDSIYEKDEEKLPIQ